MTKQRINIVLPERSVSRLEELKIKTDASSITEVIKSAVMTYESVVEHLMDGVTFTGTKSNGDTFTVEFLIDVAKKNPNLRVVERIQA